MSLLPAGTLFLTVDLLKKNCHNRPTVASIINNRPTIVACLLHWVSTFVYHACYSYIQREGLAVVSIARDDPSTLPSDDPFPRARMHRDRSAR